MTRKHLYFAIEALNLTPTQRATLISALRQLGPASDPQPARLNHWRTRPDGNAAIYEANFQDTVLTIDAMKTRLANIFSIDPTTITHAAITRTYAHRPTPIVTFNHAGLDKLRMAVFGGPDATWHQSRTETVAYIAANAAQWDTPNEPHARSHFHGRLPSRRIPRTLVASLSQTSPHPHTPPPNTQENRSHG